MSFSIPALEKLPLTAHLECLPNGETLFVQAHVKKPDRSHITGSPVKLTDETEGLFFDDTLTMPDESFVTVTYKIFTNAGLTIESDDYCKVTEVISQSASGGGSPIIVNTPDRIIAVARDQKAEIRLNDQRPGQIKIVDHDAQVGHQDDQKNINKQENKSTVRTS